MFQILISTCYVIWAYVNYVYFMEFLLIALRTCSVYIVLTSNLIKAESNVLGRVYPSFCDCDTLCMAKERHRVIALHAPPILFPSISSFPSILYYVQYSSMILVAFSRAVVPSGGFSPHWALAARPSAYPILELRWTRLLFLGHQIQVYR